MWSVIERFDPLRIAAPILVPTIGLAAMTASLLLQGDGGSGSGGDGSSGDGDGGSGDAGGDDGDDGDGDDEDDESPEALKKALEKERDLRKRAQKSLRELKKAGGSGGNGSQGGAGGSGGQGGGSGQGNQQNQNDDAVARERDAYKSAAEKLTAKLLGQTVREQARTTAEKLGAIDPGAIARMLRIEDVEVDDDGEPQDIEDLVRELKKDHPGLFGAKRKGSGDGGAGNGKGDGDGKVGFGPDRLRHAYAQSGKRT